MNQLLKDLLAVRDELQKTPGRQPYLYLATVLDVVGLRNTERRRDVSNAVGRQPGYVLMHQVVLAIKEAKGDTLVVRVSLQRADGTPIRTWAYVPTPANPFLMQSFAFCPGKEPATREVMCRGIKINVQTDMVVKAPRDVVADAEEALRGVQCLGESYLRTSVKSLVEEVKRLRAAAKCQDFEREF